jgi:hypothetical protein
LTRTWGGSAIGGDIVLELTPSFFFNFKTNYILKTRKLAVIFFNFNYYKNNSQFFLFYFFFFYNLDKLNKVFSFKPIKHTESAQSSRPSKGHV